MFAFCINVADESQEQLEHCLQHLRCHYPTEPVYVVNDGTPFDYAALAHRFGCIYVAGRYVKRFECGGMWWQRTLSLMVQSGAEWLVKLDPDTLVHRRLEWIGYADVLGTIVCKGQPDELVQGGFQILRREAAQRLLTSGLLQSEQLQNPYAVSPNGTYGSHWLHSGYLSTDFQLMWLIRKLRLSYADFTEVACDWQDPPDNHDLDAAVTHPHKFPRHVVGATIDEPLKVVVTCKGRLEHLKRSLPRWMAERNVKVTVVDYDCPQRAGDWVAAHYPAAQVIRFSPADKFNLNRARNLGAVAAGTGWLFITDADILIQPGFADVLRRRVERGYHYLAYPVTGGVWGSVLVHSDDYVRAEGYDELYEGWGCDDIDFYLALRCIGVRPAKYPSQFLSAIRHGDDERERYHDVAKDLAHGQNREYFRRKASWAAKHGRAPSLYERAGIRRQALAAATAVPASVNHQGEGSYGR